jgi:ribosomal protein L11 methyltransferase
MSRSWPALEVSVLDDLVQAALVDYDVAAIDEDASRVFFHSREARDRASISLRQQFPRLTATPLDVPDEDWAARSQASLTAVRVGNIVVAPPWDLPPDTPELKFRPPYDRDGYVGPNFSSGEPIAIVIQPSMGFGTGHHATTRLCLAHLQALDLAGRSAIDVGTGSGVLAIAASRLGAVHVLAIDDDEDAIASARENVSLNPGAEVTLGTVDLRRAGLRPFDVVLANLTGGLLVAAAAALLRLAAPGGRLVVSGFMESEEREVNAAFASCEVERRSQEDEWVCVTLRTATAAAASS